MILMEPGMIEGWLLFSVFMNVYAPVVEVERSVFLDVLNEVTGKRYTEEYFYFLVEVVTILTTAGFHGNQSQYTQTHVRDNLLSMARLDRFYFSKHDFNVYKSCFISPAGFPDHSSVTAFVLRKCVKPSSAYWHFNMALLKDKNFKDAFVYLWRNHQIISVIFFFLSVQQCWDIAKYKIGQLRQQLTQNVTKTLMSSLKASESEVEVLQDLAKATEPNAIPRHTK